MKCRSIAYLAMIATLCALAACGGGSASSTTDSTDGTTDGTTTTSAPDSTADTVPVDLAVSSPTAVTSASSSLSAKAAKPGDFDSADYKEKIETAEQFVLGTGECAFTLQMDTPTRPDCYGPTLNVCNHPNATTSDQDCGMPQGNGLNNESDDVQLPQGDLGIWSATEDDQACAAAQMNYLVDTVASIVDNMVKVTQSVACAGEKANVALPAANASSDLKAVLAEHVDVEGLTFDTATLARGADTSDGDPVYTYTLAMSLLFPGQQTATEGSVTLTHIPKKDDKDTYRGKMRMQITESQADMNCPQGTDGSLKVVEIYYQKSGTTFKYDMNSVPFCGRTAVAANPLDPTEKSSESNPDGWGGNWNYGRYNVDTSNGTGTVAYAWQAGKGDGFTRVLNVVTSAAADGSASGDAYFGFGNDIASTDNGEIQGFWCNWAGPGNAKTQSVTAPNQLLAQKQGMTRAVGATKFVSDSSDLSITFAPTNNCNASAGMKYFVPTDANNKTFPQNESDTSTMIVLDNNKTTAASTVTNNLIGIADIVFTQPTAPDKTGL